MPNYYSMGIADGSVHGVSVAVKLGGDEVMQLTKVGLRQSLPLQSTLFQISEAAGKQLSSNGLRPRESDLNVSLALLYEPAMQGTVANPDWDGFEPQRRALFVAQGNRSAWRFDPQQTSAELLAAVTSAAEITVPEHAGLYSFVAQSNQAPAQGANVPQAELGNEVRPPAVADRFYPGDPQQLSQLLDQLRTL